MSGTSIRGMQSFLFAEELRKQFDAMEHRSACNKARLQKSANSYRDMGLSTDEIKELVAIDSRSVVKEAVDAFVDVVAGEESTETYNWDFSILDKRGKKWSSSSYGLRPVKASTAEEALEVAARNLQLLVSVEDGETVIDAERVVI